MRIWNGSHNSNGGQIHWFGNNNQIDIFNIGLNNISTGGNPRHDSHHIYGNGGGDVYNFTDFASLQGATTGRLDTFDPTRDVIQIEGTTISLSGLPQTVNGINVAVVEYQGQQWLRMKDGNSDVALFALEGARLAENLNGIVPPGNLNPGAEEQHFRNLTVQEVNSLPVVAFENPNNLVPHSLYASAESGMNWTSGKSVNVYGTTGDDILYAHKHGNPMGMGGDRGSQFIYAGAGNDVINARSGNDVAIGWTGNDAISGGLDADIVFGDAGNDTLYGGTENDQVYGGSGNDVIDGGQDNDVIRGGAGRDDMTGGIGDDVFLIGADDLIHWGSTSGSTNARYGQLDVINDFVLGEDKIHFLTDSGVDALSDLKIWKKSLGGDVHYVVRVKETGDRFLINVEDSVTWSQLTSQAFSYGDHSGNEVTTLTDDDLISWNSLSGTSAQRYAQLNIVEDFDVGIDQIRFDQTTGVTELSDLSAWKTTINGNVFFVLNQKGVAERILVDVADNVSWGQFLNEDNFIFASDTEGVWNTVDDADMIAWGSLSGNAAQRYAQLNVIEDFDLGLDVINFATNTGIDELSDLQMWQRTISGDLHYVIRNKANNERILVDVADGTSYADLYNIENFVFG